MPGALPCFGIRLLAAIMRQEHLFQGICDDFID
jgi:hypothetical protein